jgi:prepilin signal peptidase PulO-like enzyme (type II secretory pathway)
MQTIIIFFTAILGASLGSFVSVLNDRIEKGSKGIVFGRSICPLCRKKLKMSDLVPLISYIFLRGKCRYCSKGISIVYPALEVISALTFVALYLNFPFVAESPAGYSADWHNLLAFSIFGVYAILFTAIFFYDLLHNEVPELYLYILIGLTLAGSLILGKPDIASMGIALLIALFFFGGQHIISKGKWLGDGDIFFSVSMAFILGWKDLLVAIIAAYLMGSVISVILLVSKRADKKTPVPFTPFLILGTYVAIMFGGQIWDWWNALLMF